MRELLNYANKYIKRMNVADVAMLKVCLCSLGVLAGLSMPKKHKKKAASVASMTYAFTYAPLMTKFLVAVLEESKKKTDEHYTKKYRGIYHY